MPRTKDAQRKRNEELDLTYQNGYMKGEEYGREKAKHEATCNAIAQRNALHLEALKAMSHFLSMAGQTMQTVADAMKSEKGQL